ncbi:hypothetical protein VE01_10341 [Pseudogymnoascus verrucosus]|uniref:Vacuolar membrane protein n=1 Tax=Pseudogymnoascus verrucosus TaxID=342668 RepID=A0A1B8G759_9PEZI|nr:uncharacterized protein VE01_10341 [Pseudogymnoascus verrucosus]OBT91660.1 hypothetical protein VE01_10341 [Pseudogymnoascus verrucosus]
MLCGRKKAKDIKLEEKWDFISLQDFKASSFFEYLAYGYLWLSLVISIAVYGVDTFTAYNLIALNKFTSIEPVIKLDISKWIFAGCIIASWVNVIYEHIRAHLIIRRGAVAESYLDSLAVRLQAIRVFGQGRGWKRFLVFSELTKSKKGAEYVALFTYFSFQSWIRVIFCSGPRQVINALTLRSVYIAQLDPKNRDAATSILQFFKNFGILADQDKKQAVVLSGMVFTLVVWIFAALSLLLAMLFYLLFLWHYIPNGDGGLSGYCERKINGRLQKIVSVKINKAIEEEERKRNKANQKAFKNGEKPTLGRQATLPTLFDTKDDNKLPSMPMLNRNDTTATLPMYTSRPGTPSSQQPKLPDFELSNMDQKRPVPSRLNTATSASSYGASSGLVANAADMGYSRTGSPAPPMPGQEGTNGMPFPAPQRTMTGGTNASQGSWAQQQRVPQQLRSGPAPLQRQGTQDSYGNVAGNGMGNGMGNGNGNGNGGFGPPQRQMTQDSYNSYNPPSRNMTPFDRVASPMDRSVGNTPFDRVGSPMDRSMGGNTPLARIASPMDRSMGNNTPITRTDSPLSYTSRPGQNYTPAPSALSQDPYAPQRNNNQSQNHDSYDPYSTASPTRATHAGGVAMDDEPTLPSFDAPTIVAPPRGDTPSSHYAPSIASSRGAGDAYSRPGPPPAGQNAQTRYGRSTPSQGSIESSVGRRTPAFDTASVVSDRSNGNPYAPQRTPAFDTASVVSDRSNGNPYAPQQQQQQGRMGLASPTGSYAQPVRSASAGVGQQGQGYARPPPGRNMTDPNGGQGGYNAYGGGGGGGGGYRQ